MSLSVPLKPWVYAKVGIYAFKKFRKYSVMKHTGVLFVLTNEGNNYGYVHEVTGGTATTNLKTILKPDQKSKLVTRRLGPDEKSTFELKKITSLTVLIDPQQLDRIDDDYRQLFMGPILNYDFLDYDWNYHLILNNCRSHVEIFAEKLRQLGCKINPAFDEWIQKLPGKDRMVVILLLVMLILFVAGVIGFIRGIFPGARRSRARS